MRSWGEREKRAAERNVLFCEKATHCLNLKEKLMDLFLLPILIEQRSADPGARRVLSVWKQISALCWVFYQEMRC